MRNFQRQDIFHNDLLQMKKCTVRLLILFAFAACSCEKQRDLHLVGGYKLCTLENIPKDSYFIVNRDDETVVAPDVLQVWFSDAFIWGYVSPTSDPAFYPVSEGYFCIRVVNGEFNHGIGAEDLRAIIPNFGDTRVFKRTH